MKQNYENSLLKGTFVKMNSIYSLLFFVLSVLSFTMYSQQTYTFTNCNATGRVGPTQLQINSYYTSTNLAGLVGSNVGIQTWTVPLTGIYRITAIGASSGSNSNSARIPGFGAYMRGDFTLTAGDVLQILVGQMGQDHPSYAAGGGGGSFVTKTPHNTLPSILVIAGGGGAPSGDFSGVDATTATCGTFDLANSSGPSQCNGDGGISFTGNSGGGGGGFFYDGQGNTTVAVGGKAYVNGGQGALSPSSLPDGGFGGGGGQNGMVGSTYAASGGGGFSGGNGGNRTPNRAGGGGGGSYNNGTNPLNSVLTATGQGRVIIQELCNITLTASGSNSVNPSICSGQSLSLTTNGVSNYSWSTGNTTSSVIVVSPVVTTVYTLSAMSPSSCIAARSITVTVSSGLPTLTITNTPTNICLGKSATITAAGALSYTWTGGSPTVTNGVSFVPGSGVNVYTVSGQNGCGTSIATTTLTVAPLPVSIASSTTSVCAGSPATLIATSAVSGYTWAPTSNTGSNTTVYPAVNTVYTVTASDGTCSGVATVSLSTIAIPTISIVPSSTMVCEGAVVTMTANGAVSYSWSVGNQTGATLSDNPMMATSYVVTGTNALGCSSSANQIVVTVSSPTVNITTNKTIVCSGNPVNLLAGGSGANSYNWTGGPATAGYTANPVVTTIYTVTGIGTNCSTTKTISISVLLASVAVAVTPTSICSGATANLSATGANTYAWTGFSGFGANVSVTPTVTTTYTMIASTTGPGLSCPSSANITLTVFDNPTVTISASHSVVCKTDAAILLTGGGALTYTWSTNVTALTTTVHPQSTITYTNQGTDANGCINTGTFKITVNTCTGIDELNTGVKGILVYPNPNNGEFTLSTESEITLTVMNELGQEIKKITLSEENGYKASLTNLANGIYFVTGQNDTGKVNQKIVVTK